MRNHSVDSSMSAQSCADELKILLTQQQYSAIRHLLKSNKGNGEWMKEFLSHDGFQNLLNNITSVCLPECRPNNSALSSLVACVTVVMATKQGLDTAATSPTVLNSLILGLISDDELVKRDILTLLATLTLHSATAYRYVLDSFTHFKKTEHTTYRFIVLIEDLRNTESVEYRKSLLNLINCLIDRSTISDKRIDLRNEMIALGLLEVLRTLRNTQDSSVAQQIVHFYEQKAKDEKKLAPSLDVNDPSAMFSLLWRKIAKTPRSNDLLKIVQKLLFTVDTSDLWGAAIDALSGPRSTQGVFKESSNSAEIQSDDKARFPEPPESPGCFAPPQTLDWRAISSETALEHSVWARVNLCQNKINVRNIRNYFFEGNPNKAKLRYISEEKAISLNLLLASVDSNSNRKAAVELITNALIDGDTTIIPDSTLRRLSSIIPRDPALMSALSEYNGDLAALDMSELLLVSISRIPEFETRLKCMLGTVDIPKALESLEACENHYSSVIKSLLDLNCPFFDLLKLVLDMGNTLNDGPIVHGFKLEALQQLKSMKAPRQPALTLLHFLTQSLAKTHPETLDFLSELTEELEECKKQTIQELDDELRKVELQLREIRALLVEASKDVKLQFTSVIVDSGKRVTCLKNKRKTLDNRINDFAEFYCEPIEDFCLSSYFSNLLTFCSDVVECKEMYNLSLLCNSDNRNNYSPEIKTEDNQQTCEHHGPSCNESCGYNSSSEGSLLSPPIPPRSHCGSIISAYDSQVSEYDYQNRRATNESDNSVFVRGSSQESDSGYPESRRNTYESEMSTKSEPVGISLESRLVSPPPPPPKPQRPVGIIYDSNREMLNFQPDVNKDKTDSNRSQPNRRSGDLKKMHSNYRSVDLSINRSRSQDYFDRYNSTEYRSAQYQTRSVEGYKDRYRHSPPTREQDDTPYESDETSSEDSGDDTLSSQSESLKPGGEGPPPTSRSESDALRVQSEARRNEAGLKPRGHESRSVGHAASLSMMPPVSRLNSTFGGSCRSFQHQRSQRTDVRDLFASNDRYGSSSSINSFNKQKVRLPRDNPHQTSIQALIRGDQNSNAIRREPPPVPKREPSVSSGMGKKETSRSTPALNYNPNIRSPRSYSVSPPSISPPFVSPAVSPPPSGTLSPPLPGTLSPPTRFPRERPFSGTSLELPIDENAEVHHERQSSEPTDMRYSLENSRLGGGGQRAMSLSSTEINTAGLETEV